MQPAGRRNQFEFVRVHQPLDKAGVVFALAKFRVAHDRAVERNRRFDPGDVILIRARGACDRSPIRASRRP